MRLHLPHIHYAVRQTQISVILTMMVARSAEPDRIVLTKWKSVSKELEQSCRLNKDSFGVGKIDLYVPCVVAAGRDWPCILRTKRQNSRGSHFSIDH